MKSVSLFGVLCVMLLSLSACSISTEVVETADGATAKTTLHDYSKNIEVDITTVCSQKVIEKTPNGLTRSAYSQCKVQ